jgi:hypothetical protein
LQICRHGRIGEAVAQDVEVVAADTAQDAGETLPDLIAVGPDDVTAAGVEGRLRRPAAGVLLPFLG